MAVVVTRRLPFTFFTLPTVLTLIARLVGWKTSDWVSTVAAALILPTSGMYGVQSDRQRCCPATVGPSKELIVKSASSSFAPNMARPGVPTGTSGGGRQTVILIAEQAVSAPLAWSTKSGTFSVWPAAWRFRTRIE